MQAPPPPKSALGIYRLLSPSAGVRVSPLCLGAMSFGTAWKGLINSECSKEDTFKILDHYYENGGNFIDIANVYHQGQSEQWIGDWMKERGNRDEMVIATKYTGPSPVPFASAKIRVNFAGNHTKSLVLSVEASLKQMQTSYIDILYIHFWDFSTSIPETMQALNRLVNAGKVLYLGISDAPAWVALKANLYAEQHGLAQFVVYQGMYSAAVRDCEREILPVCEDSGMAFAPYGSQGGGQFRTKEQLEAQKQKGENRTVAMYTANERYERVSAVLEEIAKDKGVKMTQLALAWTLQRAPNVFPIIGCRKLEYLQDAMDSLTIKLSEEESEKIDRASKFEPGFPISFTFQHFDDNFNYKPSMTLADTTLARMGSRLAIVEKQRPIPAHDKEELAGGKEV